MTQAPVGRQSQRLRAIHNFTNNVRCQECQIDKLLNPALGGASFQSNSFVAQTVFELPIPSIGKRNILDEHLINIRRPVTNNDLHLNASATLSERKLEHEVIWITLQLSAYKLLRPFGIETDRQFARSDLNPFHDNEGYSRLIRIPKAADKSFRLGFPIKPGCRLRSHKCDHTFRCKLDEVTNAALFDLPAKIVRISFAIWSYVEFRFERIGHCDSAPKLSVTRPDS
ncbi:hypothetical protein BOA8489_02635 [Boseongicola aestuarii]|uniref:Uncharacterized protein n=1 Tax=Boseongicola aestuarii TaxID=1470561 RepID=A0A238J199_9RHOB|nr:hypothetical protein BOA8489_02635 [Boseongicola aestuarii]